MKIRMTGTEAHLEGDWIRSEVERNIDTLAHTLQQLEFGKMENLRIDCGEIHEADETGLELLHVWLECAKIRGMNPILVNINAHLQLVMQELNFRPSVFADSLTPNMVA